MVLPEENNASPVKLDGANTFIDSTGHTNISGSIHEKYQNDQNEFVLYPTLDYINQILLEDIDEPFSEYQDVAALSDIEKPLYDIVGEKYPPAPNAQLVVGQSKQNHDCNICILNKQIIPKSTNTSLSQESRNESLPAKEFQRGVEEGKKFLPYINNIAIDLQVSRLSPDIAQKQKISEVELEEDNVPGFVGKPRIRKSSGDGNLNILEGQKSKISMASTDEITRDEMYDKVLLYHGEESVKEDISRLRKISKHQVNPQFNQMKNLEDNIDLEFLLVQCSEAVALGNWKMAEEVMKDLRKHVSPVGSVIQRLACILTDGLEARLAGTGSESYRQLVNRRISTREILKAYHMNITASPLLRISYCFANDYICKVAEDASKIHIIDFGITFGFQWPPLIQALAKRRGGAPKLRITGIDLPQPGLRPAERLKQVGVRLDNYAKIFGVPFEYQCIASLWESICIKDLKIDDDEVLIVNSMFRFMHVRDDMFPTDSPRNQVLNLIRQIKPKGFIIGILNVSYGPFFTTRFKKVLSLYSMLFDMFDTLVPRDDEGRQLMERAVLGPQIFNLVACEGRDQVEKPETYKQWHKRISKAGLKLLAMNHEIVKVCNAKLKSGYPEGFFVQEESNWLLQGWKGRIIYGLSVWEPKEE